MANIQINIVENGTTTLATSGCICDRNIDINVDVPSTGEGGERSDFIPDEALYFSGNCSYQFSNGKWDWFLNQYADDITTGAITEATQMFYCSKLERMPFTLNFQSGGCACGYMLGYTTELEYIPPIDFKQTGSYKATTDMFLESGAKEIGKLSNLYPEKFSNFFKNCKYLRQLPEFENLNLNRIHTYAYANSSAMFQGCYSLRSIPEELLKQIYTSGVTSVGYLFLNKGFNCCYTLDEIRGFNPQTGALTGNGFDGTFNWCHRIKDMIFATQEDGTPYTCNWKNQTIDLSSYVGYAQSVTNILNYNSGITADKQVTDDVTYQTLKDDPDWFTLDVAYSRYNHDSAVNTINSLPDVSASGGTNTIKFKGESGSATDGGAINTLTEEEIAVATAKGWTVTIV